MTRCDHFWSGQLQFVSSLAVREFCDGKIISGNNKKFPHGRSLLLEKVTFRRDDNDICFVLDQHAEFDFYCTNSLKQQFAGSYRNVAPLKTY
jgi:hypothetical protein